MSLRTAEIAPQTNTTRFSQMRSRLSRLPVIAVAPLLVFASLMAWALASPTGSSPDDDFHLVSTWCASPNASEFCLPGTDSQSRIVPRTLVDAPCFAYKPEFSAACQKELDFTAEPTTLTTRGNFVGAYPGVYYAVMGLFASNNIEASVVAMRAFTVLLFTAFTTALFLLLPIRRRPALVWGWVLTTVPLGMFILASNNPSSWSTMGVGFGWIALLGFFETDTDRHNRGRKIALGAIFVLGAVMAAGSRGDGALYSIIGIVAVGILAFSRSKRFLWEAILPFAVLVMCVLMYRFSRPVASVTEGVSSDSSHLFVTIVNNLPFVPSLWLGVLGKDWGLGWLDTSIPSIVWCVGLACFVGVGFIGAKGLSARRLVVLFGGTLLLFAMPAILLAAAGDNVGENLQPRYLLPLVVLFAGIMTLSSGWAPNRLTRPQWILIASALSVTQFISLYLNMQRYISSRENQSVNLDDDIQWWWHMSPSPMAVMIIGSVSYAALIFIVLRQVNRAPVSETRDVSPQMQVADLRG